MRAKNRKRVLRRENGVAHLECGHTRRCDGSPRRMKCIQCDALFADGVRFIMNTAFGGP